VNELIEFATSWKTYLGAVLLFSLAPDVVLRLAVLAYPKGHARRRELVAELKVVPRRERPFWVAEQVTSVVVEGFGQRQLITESRRAHVTRGALARRAVVRLMACGIVAVAAIYYLPLVSKSSIGLIVSFAIFVFSICASGVVFKLSADLRKLRHGGSRSGQ